MADTKRVPTELEAKFLLREVDRRMEDERALGEYLDRARPRLRPGAFVVGLLVMSFCAGVLAFLESRGQPMWIWGAILCLGFVTLTQSIEIGRLIRVTTALARMSERTRGAEPLPRAPSPPAAEPR